MGSPEFALPILTHLAERMAVVGVVTQPDRPSGRGRKMTAPPIKILAEKIGLPVIQPVRLKDPGVYEQLSAWKPDVVVVAAFGQILKPNVLELPFHGCINVHASLLPRWRGASPIQAAILHGDTRTGITIMKMDPGLDTGPILDRREMDILQDDTTGTLSIKLSNLGAELLLETLPKYLAGELYPIPPDESLATTTGLINKENGQLDFQQSSTQLERKVRAYNPWPSAFLTWKGGVLKVLRAASIEGQGNSPGWSTEVQGKPAVYCSEGILVLEEVQPAGKTRMPGEVFLRGARNWLNSKL